MQFLSIVTLLGFGASALAAPTANAGALAVRDTFVVNKTFTTVSTLKFSVSEDVSAISTVVKTANVSLISQTGLVTEITTDLEAIVGSLTTAVGAIVADALTAVIAVTSDVLAIVEALLNQLLDIVVSIVNVVETLVANLLAGVLTLVEAEITAVLNLLSPLLTPVLTFVGTLTSSDAVALTSVHTVAANLLKYTNTFLVSQNIEVLTVKTISI